MGYSTFWNADTKLSRKLTDDEIKEFDSIFSDENKFYCWWSIGSLDEPLDDKVNVIHTLDIYDEDSMKSYWYYEELDKIMEFFKEKSIYITGQMNWDGEGSWDIWTVHFSWDSYFVSTPIDPMIILKALRDRWFYEAAHVVTELMAKMNPHP